MNFYDDRDVQEAFVEENKSDFWDWCRDNNISPRKKYHQQYCAANTERFTDFIDEYKDDLMWNEAEQQNNLRKDNI